MTTPIVLVLPYPVSSNRYKATRIIKNKASGKPMALYYRTHEAEAFVKACQAAALAAGLDSPLEGRLELAYRLYPHRPLDWQSRMRKLGPDWDDTVQSIDGYNAEKVMADALQGIVYANDKQVWKGAWERMPPDEHGARLVVYIRTIPRRTLEQESPQQQLIPDAK